MSHERGVCIFKSRLGLGLVLRKQNMDMDMDIKAVCIKRE